MDSFTDLYKLLEDNFPGARLDYCLGYKSISITVIYKEVCLCVVDYYAQTGIYELSKGSKTYTSRRFKDLRDDLIEFANDPETTEWIKNITEITEYAATR